MSTSELQACAGSFRDPSGSVYTDGRSVYRTINRVYAEHWEAVEKSGFLKAAAARGLVISYEEVPPLADAWKTVTSPLLPCISYPYEWCFGQLRDAALHTLDVLDAALEYCLILRDATAYNIQFVGAQAIFIDLLSFETWAKDKPWKAYMQFCRHFLAPLALMVKCSVQCGKLLSNWIEGLPLDLAASLLPWSSRFSPSLGMHIHMHARMQARYADARKAADKLKQVKVSEKTIPNLSKSLRLAVEGLHLPQSLSTEWGDYYSDTNYSQAAAEDKKNYLLKVTDSYVGPRDLAVDLGANTAVYSEFLAESFRQVIALDVDYLAVEKLYQRLHTKGTRNITPLVIDLCNPPPAIGWANEERPAFKERCTADYLSALAIIHHLRFTGGIPLAQIARLFASLLRPGGLHVLEFVPMEDSQVQRLLAARDDSFPDYTLESCLTALDPWFEVLDSHPVTDSARTMLLLQRR